MKLPNRLIAHLRRWSTTPLEIKTKGRGKSKNIGRMISHDYVVVVERRSGHVPQERVPLGWRDYRQPLMRAQPTRLVFIDETSVKANMTPLRGRSLRGQRLLADAPFGKWHTQTFIAGLRCHELVAPWIIEGAIDSAAFDVYVEIQLAPALSPGDIVILDNLNVHRSPRALQALKQRGAWFLFLPKYSPDLNPIEMAFAKLKTLLRKAKTRNYHDRVRAIGNICYCFEPDECWNYLKKAGYVAC